VGALAVLAGFLVVLISALPAEAVSIREFSIPTAGSRPLTLTEGPDGAMWFTEFATNRIGRITTGGRARRRNLARPFTA
jgi:streptogramin lyase